MIDLAKITCKLHPSEYINLFCAQNSCRTALCPTCVCQHTQTHICKRTQPVYQHIRSTYSRVHEEIASQIEVIKQDNNRLSCLFDTIRTKKQNFRQTLELAKQDCLKIVVDYFSQLQQKWEAEMQAQQKKNCLHNSYRLQVLSQLLTKQLQKLITQSKKMNASGFLERIQAWENDILVESQIFHSKFSEQLDQNQQYRPSVNYLKGNLQSLKTSLEKILRLQYNIPIQRLLGFDWDASQKKRLVSSCSNWNLRDPSLVKPQQIQNKDLFSMSTVIKRVSTQKPILQGKILQSNSSLFIGVPRVLTTSTFQPCSTPSTPKMIQSVTPLQNSSILRLKNQSLQIRRDKPIANSSGQTLEQTGSKLFQKCERAMSNKSGFKAKKNGLTLSGKQNQFENTSIVNKQNSKKL